jgi:hypothetical protein
MRLMIDLLVPKISTLIIRDYSNPAPYTPARPSNMIVRSSILHDDGRRGRHPRRRAKELSSLFAPSVHEQDDESDSLEQQDELDL